MRVVKVMFALWLCLNSLFNESLPATATVNPSITYKANILPVQTTILKLVWIQNAETRHAVCNDGTPAGYYFLAGTGSGSTTWVIHLQGGGMCYNGQDCLARKADPTMQNLISSKLWTPVMDMTDSGIMSADPLANPYFYNANHVYIRYCSSDLYSGARDTSLDNAPWYFRGRSILEAILQDLDPQLKNATKVLFLGGSAGGVGVLANLDWVAQYLQAKYGITYIKGLDDAGWFINIQPFDPSIPDPGVQLQEGYSYWNAHGNLNLDCAAANPGNEWRCFMGIAVYSYIKTPLFVYNSQFDNAALTLLGDVPPYTAAGYTYRDVYGKDIVASLSPRNILPVFSPESDDHAIADHTEFTSLKILGVSLSDMLGPWFNNMPGPRKMIEARAYLPFAER